MANDPEALAQIPGVTPEIIGAGVHTLQEAYLNSFKGVWIAAAVLSGVTLLGKEDPEPEVRPCAD